MSQCEYLHNDIYCFGQKNAPAVYCGGDINKCDIPGRKEKLLKEKKYTDMVNHPSHYNAGGIECIDALAAATAGVSGIEAFCTANAIKYLWRWKFKNGVEDLKKAIWYINYLIEHLDSNG